MSKVSTSIHGSLCMPISRIYEIMGVGDVLAGRVDQGVVKPEEKVVFLHTQSSIRAPRKCSQR